MTNMLFKSHSFPVLKNTRGHFAPSLFQDDIFYKFFKTFEEDSYYQKKTIPYNVYDNEDDEGNLVSQDFEFAVSGFKKEDLNISVKDGYLEVSGSHEEQEEKRKLTYGGMSGKSFSYRFGGAQGVSPDDVKANLEDGVLKVTVNRAHHIDNGVSIPIE